MITPTEQTQSSEGQICYCIGPLYLVLRKLKTCRSYRRCRSIISSQPRLAYFSEPLATSTDIVCAQQSTVQVQMLLRITLRLVNTFCSKLIDI
jgi:hypothetical protein